MESRKSSAYFAIDFSACIVYYQFMARKRKKLQHLDYNSPQYWECLLAEEGLTMDCALQRRHLQYVGDSTTLEFIEGVIRTDTGRIEPKPQAE